MFQAGVTVGLKPGAPRKKAKGIGAHSGEK